MARTKSGLSGRLILGLLLLAAPLSAGESIDYRKQIRPILSNHCYKCHGPDTAERKAGLRLDLKDPALAELESGSRAIVQGEPDQSTLVERINSTDADYRMPPAEHGKSLTADQIDLLVQWVKEGATWDDHWSFQPPRRPDLPPVKNAAWAKSPLDFFVLAKLEREGLAPSEPADRAALIRRLTLDLTGLPPTPEEIDAFLADQSPGAYEALVDRLLQSPRFGEHMAHYWLDAARYGDTHGLHLDNYRSMWPYRDWVIKAFNNNMPFDRFTIEQIAGDLLPNRTVDQQIASGFNRCNVTTSEGGSIDEEFYVRYTVDRVETVGTIWMGLSLGCAVCHDHKYDPVSQKEFYQLFAYFNNITERPMDGNAQDPPPVIKIATDEQRARVAELDKAIAERSTQLAGPMPEVDQAQAQWEEEWSARLAATWSILKPAQLSSTGGATLRPLDDGSVLAEGANPAKDTYEVVLPTDATSLVALRLECLTHESLVGGGPGRAPNANFVLSEIEVDAVSKTDPSQAKRVEFAFAYADYSQKDYAVENVIDGSVSGNNGWAVSGNERHENRVALFVAKEPFGDPGGTELKIRLRHESPFEQHGIGRFRLSVAADPTLSPVQLGPWHVVGPFASDSGANAFKTDFGPESAFDLNKTYGTEGLKWVQRRDLADDKPHDLRGNHSATYLARTITVASPRAITIGLGFDDAAKVWLDGKVILEREGQRSFSPEAEKLSLELSAGEHQLLAKIVNFEGAYQFQFRSLVDNVGAQVVLNSSLLAVPASQRTAADQARVRDYFRSNHSELGRKLHAELAQMREEKKQIEANLTSTLVMQEMDGQREAFMLVRGQYDKKGDKVGRAVPAFLPPLPQNTPNDRLGLAAWLVDPSHPLTARVTANRLWQQLFGVGIVKTAEDFGSQGEWPSHPELLDWLATEFVRMNWDVKRFMKMVVMSSTYQQSPHVSADLAARDPENRLLARGPRFRLDAEQIRDQALYVGGLLLERVGGPSVRTYQPPGVWEAVAYPTSNTANFQRGNGEELYRRSLYTFWKRTAHPPAMQTFDAPSRETCSVRRPRTNTPLQALVLMNDEQFVEAARGFAQRLLAASASDDERLVTAFRWATSRSPTVKETAILQTTLAKLRERYHGDAEAAKKLIEIGEAPTPDTINPSELAAWTMFASTLLNLDEAVTKG